ncbi:hypothetical protein K8T06_03525 [bacterium]|nr:hypothetical protein [bacterium]
MRKNIGCKFCGHLILLAGDNVGCWMSYYGTCEKCNSRYSVGYDAINQILIIGSETWRKAD